MALWCALVLLGRTWPAPLRNVTSAAAQLTQSYNPLLPSGFRSVSCFQCYSAPCCQSPQGLALVIDTNIVNLRQRSQRPQKPRVPI